jgi:regulator of protease activity HflC (stomatin/prohibitin superfamily)
MTPGVMIMMLFILFLFIIFMKTIHVVPQREAFVIERLGKYSTTLSAGFYILIPFIDRVAYRHTLKEIAVDVPSQTCITKDNVAVEVDGILYLQVVDPVRASYGINDYLFASAQLAQTTMRSVIGKLDLDNTFVEREMINAGIVGAVDKASDPWGVKITRYEVKNITPPRSINEAMEKQMRAEREKRAQILESEGERQAKINRAEGIRQETIAFSEGEKQKRINEAEGQAAQIELVARATAQGIREIAQAIQSPGGQEAVSLRVAEQYLIEFGKLAKVNNTMIVPSDLTDLTSVLALSSKVLKPST